ncbi:hypothetical protein Tco_0834488 [Tanacetum coccineum]
MVACLEKSEGDANFHEIVDFLTASSVHYALTISPTIYASYIEQNWNTAHSQIVNDVKQIHATVDGKTVVISKSSVRTNLHFNNEDGITCLTNDAIFENLALMGYESDSNKLTFQKSLFSPQWKYLIHTILQCLSSKSTSWNEFSTNIASVVIFLANGRKINFSKLIFDEPFNDVYQTHAHTKKVFTNMKRKGKDFLGRLTPLFVSMLAPPVVEGEGSGQPSEPQPAPSTAQPRIEEQIPITESSSPQNTQSPRKALQEDTQVVRATTNAASLDAAQASADRPKCQEAMGVSLLRLGLRAHLNIPMIHLSQETAQDLVIRKLKKKVRKLEMKLRARTPGIKLFKIGTSKRKSLDEEYLDVDNAMENAEGDAETQGGNTVEQITTNGDIVNTASIDVSAAGPSNVSTADPSTSTAGDIFEDEMMTIVDTLVAIRSTIPRTTSVVIREVEEEPRDAEIAQRLHEEEKAELERMQRQRAAQEEASNAALIIGFDNVQARMEADALLAARLQEKKREQFSIDEQARCIEDINKDAEVSLVDETQGRSDDKEVFDTDALIGCDTRASTEYSHNSTLFHNFLKRNRIDNLIDEMGETTTRSPDISLSFQALRMSIKSKAKRESKEDDEAEMKKHMEIVQDKEEIAIDAIPLATKPTMIVEYKIVKEGQKGLYHLIRADGNSNRINAVKDEIKDISEKRKDWRTRILTKINSASDNSFSKISISKDGEENAEDVHPNGPDHLRPIVKSNSHIPIVKALEYHIPSMRETYDHNQEAAIQLMQNQMGQMAEALQENPLGVLREHRKPGGRGPQRVQSRKAITYQMDGLTLDGSFIPHSNFLVYQEKEQELETITKVVEISSSQGTPLVPPPKTPPLSTPKMKENLEPNPHQPPIPCPTRCQNDKF